MRFEGNERFELRRKLGTGGMGHVFEAFDRNEDRVVALKVLKDTQPQALYWFKREFRSVQEVVHPNLVRLGELTSQDDVWFFTMELVRGVDLLTYIRGADRASDVGHALTLDSEDVNATISERSFDESRIRSALLQLARGLHALHEKELVHRDIKPSNVLVDSDGRVVVLDFGLVADAVEDEPTTEAVVVGTAAYMAPEQALSSSPSPAADWYSVGVVLYEALTGTVPHVGPYQKVINDKQHIEPIAPRRRVPRVPADLEQLCLDLLRIDPKARPTGPDVVARLEPNVPARRTVASTDTPPPSRVPLFIGRVKELAELNAAFAETSAARPATIVIQGESGIGKTALVRHFLEANLDARPVVLQGRCYERESVPHKALDGVVDALSHYLRGLDDVSVAALLPRRAALLPRVFPVLDRVDAIARSQSRGSGSDTPDPHELMSRVVTALRELLSRIAERRPLIVTIDDIQWADADSLRLLGNLLASPDAPAMLTVLTARRTDDGARTRWSQLAAEIRVVDLKPLAPEEAQSLASELLDRFGVGSDSASAIASEARGHPMYIGELVQHCATVATVKSPDRRTRLDDAILHRVDQLPAGAQTALEMIAVAGTPLSRDVVREAARMERSEFTRWLSVLRTGQLARIDGRELVECYHDRVREAVTARLAPAVLAERHARLATAWRSAGAERDRPEMLLLHLEASGQRDGAARCAAEAARHAAESLAFDRAAELYRRALELGDYDAAEARVLLIARAEALAAAGRGADAADVFLSAAEGADAATRLSCLRQASEQLLISGHIEAGLEAIGDVLAEFGERLPATPNRALGSLLWQRLCLKLRGLNWRPRDPSLIDPQIVARLDAYRAIAFGLAIVDPVCGFAFQSRCLRLALRTGATVRVGTHLALDACHSASHGKFEHAHRCIDRVRELAASDPSHYLAAWERVSTAFATYFAGRFATSAELFGAAAAVLRDRTTNTTFELNNCKQFEIVSMRHIGAFARGRLLWTEFLRDANGRGDHYLATSLMRCGARFRLAADEADAALDDLTAARWQPPAGTFHVQHWYEVEGHAEIALYRGDATTAIEGLSGAIEKMERSLLPRVIILRCLLLSLRGRLAVATARQRPGERARLLGDARMFSRKLRREKVAFAVPLAAVIEAAVFAQSGDRELTVARLREAQRSAEECQMHFLGAAVKLRMAELIGGDAGAGLRADAEAWAAEETVRDPAHMFEVVAPGFPG